MKIKKIISIIEEWAPLDYSEDFDNVGLLTGDKEKKCSGILVTLDTNELVIDEAIRKNCNFILSFHPIIFPHIKKITHKNYVEKTLVKAIKNDISIYSIHTALDNYKYGVSHKIGDRLGLINQKILIPKKNTLVKLNVNIPIDHYEKVKNQLFISGAGEIGNYKKSSFTSKGIGQFSGNEKSNPYIGDKKKNIKIDEKRLNLIFQKHKKNKILKKLKEVHPYEEVSYEIYSIQNINEEIGMGSLGYLKNSMNSEEFLKFLKIKMNTKLIRHSKLIKNKIKKIAVLGGSGNFAIESAIQKKADVLITADLKYHDFFKANNKIILMDIGHYESEQYTKKLIFDHLTKKIPSFACVLSRVKTNPINYY